MLFYVCIHQLDILPVRIFKCFYQSARQVRFNFKQLRWHCFGNVVCSNK